MAEGRFAGTSHTLLGIAHATPPFRDIRDSDRWQLLDIVWMQARPDGGGGTLEWQDPEGNGHVYRIYRPLLRFAPESPDAVAPAQPVPLLAAPPPAPTFIYTSGDVCGIEGVQFLGPPFEDPDAGPPDAPLAVNETLVMHTQNQHLRAVGLFEGRPTTEAPEPNSGAAEGFPRVFTVLAANGSWRHATNVLVRNLDGTIEMDILRAQR